MLMNDYGAVVEFNSSPKSTIGVEVEYGIVDRSTGVLVPVASEILREVASGYPDGEHPKAKNELFQPSLEIITGICETPREAVRDLAGTATEIMPELKRRNLGLVSTGTHPYSTWEDMPVTSNPRYQNLIERMHWPAYRLLIHGVHVHVGVRSSEKAIVTTNVLATYLPLFLALSASSPFWLGRDTGLDSARTKIFEGLPTTGIPPQLQSWAEFEHLMDALVKAGTIETVREVWWDIRPHPNFGTVELRMCDGIATLEETATVAALAQCLVTRIDRDVDAGQAATLLPDWVLKENKWRACRYGFDTDLIIDADGGTEPLREQLTRLVADLGPLAAELGCQDELDNALVVMRDGNSATRQRRQVAKGASLKDVMNTLIADSDASIRANAPTPPGTGATAS